MSFPEISLGLLILGNLIFLQIRLMIKLVHSFKVVLLVAQIEMGVFSLLQKGVVLIDLLFIISCLLNGLHFQLFLAKHNIRLTVIFNFLSVGTNLNITSLLFEIIVVMSPHIFEFGFSELMMVRPHFLFLLILFRLNPRLDLFGLVHLVSVGHQNSLLLT